MGRDQIDQAEISSNEDGQNKIEDRWFNAIDVQLSSLIVVAVEEDKLGIFLVGTNGCLHDVGQITIRILFQREKHGMSLAQQRRRSGITC